MSILYQNDTLFIECMEALAIDVTILSFEESLKIFHMLENMEPFTRWGKIDWDRIDNKIDLGYEPENIMQGLKALKHDFDPSVYVLWNDASRPVIKTNLNLVVMHFIR